LVGTVFDDSELEKLHYPVSIKGVLFAPQEKIVLVRNERDEWALPGGRIEPDEAPGQCLAREIAEELSLRVEAGP
jgi:ADP-ribose pyrophosphatase YjhB (NUDIX family)